MSTEKWIPHTDGLVQEKRNSSALAMELRLSCTNQSIWCMHVEIHSQARQEYIYFILIVTYLVMTRRDMVLGHELKISQSK